MLERDAAGALVMDEETGKPKTRSIDTAASDQSSGRLVAKGDAAHFCFTPMLRFANRVDDKKWDADFFTLEAVEHTLPEVKVNGKLEKAEEKFWVCLVMWRVIGQGEFQCQFNLERFPFDEQTLAIKLLSGARAVWSVCCLTLALCCMLMRVRDAACADWDVRDVGLVRNMKAEYRSLIQEARCVYLRVTLVGA
jgi:hypothetical protein